MCPSHRYPPRLSQFRLIQLRLSQFRLIQLRRDSPGRRTADLRPPMMLPGWPG
jgi:hypothetical protein